MNSHDGKHQFAHILRGWAAVAVLIGHYFGIFFARPEVVAALLGVPVLPTHGHLPWPVSEIENYSGILGKFGVGIFFIISGFVIPMSLERSGRYQFFWRRAFRIYPVYFAGFGFTILAIFVATLMASQPFPYSAAQIITHLGIIFRWIGNIPNIDGVSWTLEIEVWFYLIAAFLSPALFRLNVGSFILIGCFLTAAAIGWMSLGTGYAGPYQVASSLLLLLGIAYFYLIQRRIAVSEFLYVQGFVALGLAGCWPVFPEPRWHWIAGYFAAQVVFGCCYFWRMKFSTESRVLSHLADISYPLYVSHALTGYAVMYWMIANGQSPYVAVGFALALAYFLALAIHRCVEVPALSFGRRSSFMWRANRVRPVTHSGDPTN